MSNRLASFIRSAWYMVVALAIANFPCKSTSAVDNPLDHFESKIRPMLVEHCYECHSENAKPLQANLNLDTKQGMRLGGDSGPAVTPGDRAQSLIVRALRHDGLKMPPDRKLPESVIKDVETWIDQGALDPREGSAPASDFRIDLEQVKEHWAFQPVQNPPLPPVKNQAWIENAIDCFVLEGLEEKGLGPSPPASRLELCRRVYFDLTGLPPSPEQIDQYMADDADDAYVKLIDQLLADPGYGQRWGQHWLDVIRYAETEGFEYDRTIPGAWRFRDYVIDSFNQAKSMAVFFREQIAGDEISSVATSDSATSDSNATEYAIAAGFHRLGPVRRNAGNQEVAGSRNEVLTERADIIASAFLGLTMGCARCHNHKFDPLSQKDYYQLQAYLAASHEEDIPLLPEDQRKEWTATTINIQEQIDALKEILSNQATEEQTENRRKLAILEKSLPAQPPMISTVRNDFSKVTPIHVLRRGEWSLPGEQVQPDTPTVFRELGIATPLNASSPRTGLAHWMTDPSHPLPVRVLVNRIWQNHFGHGIVPTPNDFGKNGQAPTNRKLLDYLSNYLNAHQWQLKPLHRMIVMSNAYRQSSTPLSRGEGGVIDPKNELLWHFPSRRLTAEEIRDSMLVSSGMLNRAFRGPSVMLPVQEQLVADLYKPTQWQVSSDIGQRHRRSIYLIAKRNLRLPFMEVFDQPSLQTSCSGRLQSTHAPQALELLNGSMSNAMADAFAERIFREAGSDLSFNVDVGFRHAIGRLPSHEEKALALEFLKRGSRREFALALFNLNAFLYVR